MFRRLQYTFFILKKLSFLTGAEEGYALSPSPLELSIVFLIYTKYKVQYVCKL